ncbi:thrombospondin-1-like [Mercenaria mercenaria]|uniref:thrombospondin-1-like n=1 Tax=Mercenaria mercenaria TaxID=6596 RepID=UPI00234EAEC8|nr:thrombospondin-1-like [Mercenaria mercenaria]
MIERERSIGMISMSDVLVSESLPESERSTDTISVRDVLVREPSFQSLPEGTFQNVPPTYDRLDHKTKRSDSIHTCSTVSSAAPLIGIKKSARPNLMKIGMVTFIVVSICTIIGLIVALAVCSNGKYKKNNNNCQNNGKTTASPLSVPDETSTQMTTSKADTDTTKITEPIEATSVESVDTSSSSVSTTTSSSTQGTWLTLGTWTECSSTCGNGIYTRYRDKSTDCQGLYVQTDICIDTVCQEYGNWATWSSWDTCDVTCDGGTQSRTRSCLKTDASDLDCIGDNTQQQQCAKWECPDCSKVCFEGDLSPTCEMCICNTTRQGVVMTTDNEAISNATVFLDSNPTTVIAYSEDFGSFSSEVVCDGGYSSPVCQISSARITCTIVKTEKPIFIEHPQPKARLVGENVTLCCSAEGIPDIKYYEWMKGSLLS